MKHNKVVILYNIYSASYGSSFAGNVFDAAGVSPTILTYGVGNRQPMIFVIDET